jgi:hypothetical protein
MLPDPHLLMMFSEQLPTDDIPIFRNNANQAVHILGMLTNQLGQFLQLPFEPLKAPDHLVQRLRALNGRFRPNFLSASGAGSYNHNTLHTHSFPLSCDTETLAY